MNQMEVTILGQSYILACPDGGERALLDAVARVDTEMSKIRDAGKVRARERMAVLAALNLAYTLAEAGPAQALAEVPARRETPSGEPLSADEDAVVESLIGRIDAVLGDDGRLI